MSTSIGVRGASVTLGKRGAHLNVGLPGSGLSYRTRIRGGDQPQANPRAFSDVAPPPRYTPSGVHPHTPAQEIRSADVSDLTSPGLEALKRLINEARTRRIELTGLAGTAAETLRKASGRLRWAETIVVRLFTEGAIPRLVDQANAAHDAHEDAKAQLAGCYVEVDFDMGSDARDSYSRVVRTFDQICTANRIWDITSRAGVDRVVERTTASTALTRLPVMFDRIEPELVRSKFDCLRLGNANGRPVQIYPGFVMLREPDGDFALIAYSELDCRFAPSNFIEEEIVPPDARQISATWKYANKNGSPDRRFANNYQIPVMQYGGLALSSLNGLAEAYMVSDHDKTADFAAAVRDHQRALLASTYTDVQGGAPPPVDHELDDQEDFEGPAAFMARPRGNRFGDWVLLTALVTVLGLAATSVFDWSKTRTDGAPAVAAADTKIEPTAALAPKPTRIRPQPARAIPSSPPASPPAIETPVEAPPAVDAGPTTAEIVDQIY